MTSQHTRFTLPALAIAFACAACGGSAPAAQAPAPSTATQDPRDSNRVRLEGTQIGQIRIEELSTHAPADAIQATGTVEFNADRMARILPPVQGQVQNLSVNIGAHVRRGQVLFELSSREVAGAIAEHLASQKDQDLSSKTLAMTRDLFEHQAASRMALQQAESEFAKAEAKVLQSEEALRVLGLDANDLTNPQLKSRVPVRAPLDGTVIERTVTDGQFVGPDVQPLLTLADLSSVWVIADVFERDLRHISVGQKADVATAAYPNERFSAQVSQIATVVDAQTRTAKVRFLVANRDLRLKPGMFTSATLYLPESPGALTIPVKAVFVENGKSYAYVQDADQTFARREIDTQPSGVERVRVTRGLAAGDRVVSDGALLLRQLEGAPGAQ